MAYKIKTVNIKNKEIIEVTKSKRLPVKSRLRAFRTDTTTKSQEEINNKNAVDSLRLSILENFETGDWFYTFSYKKEPPPTESKRLLGNFRQRLMRHCKKIGAVFKYIFVTECTPKIHRIHHHAMIKIEGNIKKEEMWQVIKNLWKHGFVKARPYGGEPDDAERIAKYMIKKNVNAFFTEPKIFKKRWYSSNNLKKPVIEKEIIHRQRWLKEPRVPVGYYLQKDSLRNDLVCFGNGEFEHEYQFYRLIRLKNSTSKKLKKSIKTVRYKKYFTAKADR